MPIPDIESAFSVPASCEVHFTQSNLTATWNASACLSLLQFAESQGLKPDHGCRSGMCGTCETRLVKGRTAGAEGDSDGRLRTVKDEDGIEVKDEQGKAKFEEERWILICCSVPVSEEIWLEK
jgi:ferredoxin